MVSREQKREAYREKAESELYELQNEGLLFAGNAMASYLMVKGDLSSDELAGAPLLSGADGQAIRSALNRLGYTPEDWACIGANKADGTSFTPETFRQAIASLDPSTLVALDNTAADVVRMAYADELAELPALSEAMLSDGVVAHILGMRVMALGGFAASLTSDTDKQLMWARLKLLPPLGEPY